MLVEEEEEDSLLSDKNNSDNHYMINNSSNSSNTRVAPKQDINHHDNKNIKRILLVDDEPDIIYWAKNVLEDNGFVVDSYTNPTLALSNFKPGLYDLLILDIKMPEINGFDLYEKMKKIDSNVRVCFLTASQLFYEEYRRVDAYATQGKEYFIQKPCENEKLIRKINEILSPR
jgi:DNA-binding response OmpR family regulator